MRIRRAVPADAAGISAVLQELAAAGLRTKPADRDLALRHYIGHANQVQCTLAEEAGRILGFQSLKRAEAGNPYGVALGWGIVGTHISPRAARRGIGAALFEVTKDLAAEAGFEAIDATIGADNAGGLAYYEAMGFRTYRRTGSAICKAYRVTQA